MQTERTVVWAALLLAVAVWAPGARAAEKRRAAKYSPEDIAARRLLARANELLEMKEHERAVKMLETVIEQYPNSAVRHEARLTLGRHFVGVRQQTKAIGHLRYLRTLKPAEGEFTDDKLKEMYVEGLYLTGVGQFQMQQYGAAFPLFRQVTKHHPNSVWANQSFYYIGMCHFAQRNWHKAIKALSLVGTFTDPDGAAARFVEAGQRLYIKLLDGDLPVLHSLGQTIQATVRSARGDEETIRCIPLASKQGIFIGSLPSVVGKAKPHDNTLQVIGGDFLTVRYTDGNTKQGEKDVEREIKLQVVSSATVQFVLGDRSTPAPAVFLGQPAFVMLRDVDRDTSDAADKVVVKVTSRYRKETANVEAKAESIADIRRLTEEAEDEYATRDEVTLTLTEAGEPGAKGPLHTGRFAGSVRVAPAANGQAADRTDQILASAVGDQVLLAYTDELHIGGNLPREVRTTAPVIGEISSEPRARQNVVTDPVLRARKSLVEAKAFLELARIFRDMGLMKGAGENSEEGLSRVEPIIRSREAIPTTLKEQAFKLKWEMHIVVGDLRSAMTACRAFHRLFPNSPFVDEALMGIGRIKQEEKAYREAIAVFKQVLALERSQAKAEAQYRIAVCTELGSTRRGKEAAVPAYRLCAQKYPESRFAGDALEKLVDYHIEAKDLGQADSLLEQVVEDHPDAAFLDQMLWKWTEVARARGDKRKAYDKCRQLVFEYPSSPHAKKAKALLAKLKKELESKK